MNPKIALWLAVGMLAGSLFGVTYHRSFRGGYPSGAQGVQRATVHRGNVVTNFVTVTGATTNKVIRVKRIRRVKTKSKPSVESAD